MQFTVTLEGGKGQTECQVGHSPVSLDLKPRLTVRWFKPKIC